MINFCREHKTKLSVFMVILIAFTLFNPGGIAFAEESVNFDKTNVLDDLRSSTVNGEAFDFTKYPTDEGGRVQIINFVEYCYSAKANMGGNYGLYIYIYNPRRLKFATTNGQNKIEMAVSYAADGAPNDYEKFNLKFCSKSEGDYPELYYKYRVIDRKSADGKTIQQRVNSDERRYDVSGIELLTYGQQNADEYGVGGTYKFTGYAAGYGPDSSAQSTLNCTVLDLETLELNIYHTNFRTNVSNLGKDHYNEVNTVYFSVPNYIMEDYGRLQKIKAEWWEYKTKPAVVTSDRSFRDAMLNYVGTEIFDSIDGAPRLWKNENITFFDLVGGGKQKSVSYDWVYNIRQVNNNSLVVWYEQKTTLLPYAFWSPAPSGSSISLDSVFIFLKSKAIAGDVDSGEVANWIYNYTNNLGHGYIDCNGRNISRDLFEDSIDSARAAKGFNTGYNCTEVDLADTFDLLSYDSNYDNKLSRWWAKLWDYGFSWPKTDGDYNGVLPIYKVLPVDLIGGADSIASNLLIAESDVGHLKEFYATEQLKGNQVFLFRFAVSDYYSTPVGRGLGNTTVSERDADTYIAQQTCFFDFDILQLTFNKNGVYKTIAAVSSPIDIINGFTAPAERTNILKLILSLIALILLLIILAPLLPLIIRLLIWIILLPFKLLAAIFRAFKRKPGQHRKGKIPKRKNHNELSSFARQRRRG